jgi:uncharacterized protein (TIGR03089 family)
MDAHPSPTVVHAFTALTATGGARPFVTFYDDATGERTELSAVTLANWVAKTANLLVDGLGLGVGDVAAVRLPAHWQTAAVLLGCWSAGLTVDLGTGPGPGTAEVAFVTETETADAGETFALALAPLGMPFRPGPPGGTQDYVVEVRGYGDHYTGPPVRPDQVALADGTTHAALVGSPSPPAGSRLLIDGDRHADPRQWLVAPLLAGGSVVLCRHLDPARLESRLTTENAVPYPA